MDSQNVSRISEDEEGNLSLPMSRSGTVTGRTINPFQGGYTSFQKENNGVMEACKRTWLPFTRVIIWDWSFHLLQNYSPRIWCFGVCIFKTFYRNCFNERVLEVKCAFRTMSGGLPQCVGAVDGCHIAKLAPKEHHCGYFNRKNFQSIILEAVVDHKRR